LLRDTSNDTVAMRSGLKPRSTRPTRIALWISRLAPASSGSANAICTATPTRRAAERPRPAVDDRPPSFVIVVKSDRPA
jgi:hypothetical protein